MKRPAPRSRWYDPAVRMLESPRFDAHPFPHFQAPWNETASVRDVHAWMEGATSWVTISSPDHRYERIAIASDRLPACLAAWAETGLLRAIREEAMGVFGVSFGPYLKVCAHRLREGDRIGLHRDSPAPGRESHRVVLFLPSEPEPCGGDLLLFDRGDAPEPARRFAPRGGAAIGFALGHGSYHEVAPVTAGVRLSLVFSFWSGPDEREHPPPMLAEDLEQRRLIAC